MTFSKQNFIYIYDESRQQIVVIDAETGEPIQEKDHRVNAILIYLDEQDKPVLLRQFAVWCARQINEYIKPIQNKFLELAEQSIRQQATPEMLQKLYDKTEGEAIATDTVGLRQGSEKASGFLATRECINPNAFEAARRSAHYHCLWTKIRARNQQGITLLHDIVTSEVQQLVKETEQKQVDHLLDLMNAHTS